MPTRFEKIYEYMVYTRHLDQYQPDGKWRPPVDIIELEDEVVIAADIPGVEKGAIEVIPRGNTLTIRGRRGEFLPDKVKFYTRMEAARGDFERVFTFPGAIKPAGAKVEYENGVLYITIKKKKIKTKIYQKIKIAVK